MNCCSKFDSFLAWRSNFWSNEVVTFRIIAFSPYLLRWNICFSAPTFSSTKCLLCLSLAVTISKNSKHSIVVNSIKHSTIVNTVEFSSFYIRNLLQLSSLRLFPRNTSKHMIFVKLSQFAIYRAIFQKKKKIKRMFARYNETKLPHNLLSFLPTKSYLFDQFLLFSATNIGIMK